MTDSSRSATSNQPPASVADAASARSGPPDGDALTLVAAGGEMADCVRSLDWASTPLGPVEQWPGSLKTVVRLMLASRFSMWMGWGPDLAFLYNDAYRRDTLGTKHPWALGRPARIVWAEIWDEIWPRIETVLRTGTATWDEALLLFLERSGYAEETYHTFSYSPVTGDDGRVAGLFCVVMEETERVIGERRLGTLRTLASALAGTSNEHSVFAAVTEALGANDRDLPFTLTYLFDADGATARRVTFTGIDGTHAGAPETLDASSNDMWPLATVIESAAPVIVDDLADRLGEVPKGAWPMPPSQAVILPIAQQGQERPAGVLIAGLNPYRKYDATYADFIALVAGQLAASLANARAVAAERQRAAQLEELDRAKTTFFSNVSHELRTPLTLMLGPIEDTLRRDDVPADMHTELDLAHRNGLRLLKLVNTLLDFSRIEAGRVDATYEPVDLATYTAELASSFRSATERGGLTLTVDAAPLAEPVYVDREMWEKVVLNLLSNAFKHTFTGGIAVRVDDAPDAVRLTVRDTGVGIPASELPHLFERFHRVPNARSRTHEGTGIGLALVQELVRLHGGTIDVESEEGVGTTMMVRIPHGSSHLPADRVGRTRSLSSTALGSDVYVEQAMRWLPDAPSDIVADVDAADVVPAEGDAAARRIVLADDNADMRDYAGRLLRSRGWRVDAVPDGQAALEHVRASRPDLVLSDVMMPRLDGFGLLRALRDDPATRTLPVILLSARAGEEARVEGLDAGADDYLAKPFSARELLARVGAHLTLAEERERARTETAAAWMRLTRVFEQAPVAIAVLRGPEHRYEMANEHYMRLPGVAGRDIVGKPIREAIPELEGQGIFELLDGVFTTQKPYIGTEVGVEMAVPGSDERQEAFFNFVYQPLLAANGETEGIAVVATDVTGLVRSRQAAERAQHEAEAANHAKSDFLAAMSHELRTPLNAIGGYAELLELGVRGPITDQQRDDLTRIQRSQQHLLSLINDVLNFAKVEAGRVEYDMTTVVLRDAVVEVGVLLEPQFMSKQVRYEAEVDPSLLVCADPEKLRQILLNLFANAVKFTPAGGLVRVTAERAAAGDAVTVHLADTGIGIAPDKLEAIFEPFVQVSRTLSRPSEGTGLGLAISRDLARGMGGDLTATSTVGEGSTFTLTLRSA